MKCAVCVGHVTGAVVATPFLTLYGSAKSEQHSSKSVLNDSSLLGGKARELKGNLVND